jgi:hypothetical protein
MLNATMTITVTLLNKYSSLLSEEDKETALSMRAADVETMVRAALESGIKSQKLRISNSGNLTCSTGSIRVEFVTTSVSSESEVKEPTPTPEEVRAKLMESIL